MQVLLQNIFHSNFGANIYDSYDEPIHSGGRAMYRMAQDFAVGNKIIINFRIRLTRGLSK